MVSSVLGRKMDGWLNYFNPRSMMLEGMEQ